jgi:thiamine-phosphate diphosphorylase
MILLPRLYAIVDSSAHASTQDLVAYVAELAAGGCGLLQYRNKSGNAQVMLEHARELRSLCRTEPALSLPKGVSDPQVRLIMNDRADLCLAAEFDGVHVGQEDLSPESVRGIIGVERWLGVSTHNPEQVREAAYFRGLSGDRARVRHFQQGQGRSCGGPRRRAAGARFDPQAAGGDWGDYAGECGFGD